MDQQAQDGTRAETSPDGEMLAALAAGDVVAADAFFDQYADRLYGLFRMTLDTREEAQAALRLTFATVADRAGSAPAGVDPGDWLLGLALEQIGRRVGGRAWAPAEIVTMSRPPDDEVLAWIGDPALRALVRTLEPARRRALVLGLICGIDAKWVARALGCDLDEVGRLQRAGAADLTGRLTEHGHAERERRVPLAKKAAPHLRPLPGPASDGMITVRGDKAYVERAPRDGFMYVALKALHRFLESLVGRRHEHLDDDTAGSLKPAKAPAPTPTTRPIQKPRATAGMRDYDRPTDTAGIANYRTPRGTPSTERLNNPQRPAGTAVYGWTRRR